MGFPFAAVAGAVLPDLVGGLAGAGADYYGQKKLLKKQNKYAKKAYKRERKDYVADRNNERTYAAQQLTNDRKYYDKMLSGDRKYSETITAKDRRYSEGLTAKDRAYNEKLVARDKAYNAARLAEDRKYGLKSRDEDKARYDREQARYQESSDIAAEKTAASRGIDFAALRDDAIKAGFNPLTAMSMAHAYSTETAYQAAAQPWTNDGAYRVMGGNQYTSQAGAGGSAGTPAGATPQGALGANAPMSIAAPSGGFQSSGGGYAAGSGPSLSAGSFIAEAVSRGLDTAFNQPDPREADYNNIMGQVQASLRNKQLEAQTPRNFGYDLSKIQPFRPTVGVLNPPFRPNGTEMSPTDDTTTPSRVGIKTPWGEVKPAGDYSDASVIEERYGDIPSAIYGAGLAVRDVYRSAIPKTTFGPPVPTGTYTYQGTGARPRTGRFSIAAPPLSYYGD